VRASEEADRPSAFAMGASADTAGAAEGARSGISARGSGYQMCLRSVLGVCGWARRAALGARLPAARKRENGEERAEKKTLARLSN